MSFFTNGYFPGKHRDLQRSTVQYARLLDIFDEQKQQNEGQDMITDS